MKHALVAALFALSATFVPPRADEEVTFRTRHYQVTSTLDRDEAQAIAAHMDKVYQEFDRRFASFPNRGSKAYPLFIFRTHAQYTQHLAKEGVNGANTGGMFYVTEKGDGLASFMDGRGRASLLETLQHEAFHQYAFVRIDKNLPPWVNEGLAEYFGAAYLVRGRFILGRVEERRLAVLKRAVGRGSTIPVGELMGMSSEEWGRRVQSGHADSRLQYDQSWSLVQFLIEGDRGRYAGMFVQYLTELSKGQQPAQALRKAFGTDDTLELEKAWKRHVEGLEPDPVSTAALRLSFLARGLMALHEAKATPRTVDELRESLQKAKFEARRMTHGGFVVLSATDPAMFQVPPEKEGKPPATLEMVEPRDPALPPGLRAKIGRSAVLVKWTRDKDGDLGYELAHE